MSKAIKHKIIDLDNKSKESIELPSFIFSAEIKEEIVAKVINWQLSNKRQGSHKVKERNEVVGSNAKIYRQKGTGRARAGTTRGPLWVGGGMAFATVDRNYTKKINKKAYKRAMQSIFSALTKEKRIIAIDSIKIDSPKTKLGIELLNSLEIENALIIVSQLESNLHLSLRNVPHITVISVENVDPISLLSHETIVIDQEAFNKLEGMFS